MNCCSMTKDKRTTSRKVGETIFDSPSKAHCQHSDTQQGGISSVQHFSQRSKGFVPHTRHPSPWDLYQKEKAPKHLARK